MTASESPHAGFLSGGHCVPFFLQGAGETGKLPRPSKQGLVGESPSGGCAGRGEAEPSGQIPSGGCVQRQGLEVTPQEGVHGGRGEPLRRVCAEAGSQGCHASCQTLPVAPTPCETTRLFSLGQMRERCSERLQSPPGSQRSTLSRQPQN